MPKITVLMTVYNGELHLREAIESILGQSFDDYEFLIIDDGCTDGSGEIIRSYNDSRIRLIDNEGNFGQTRSLNHGLRLAKGEFIARQDADDISEPDRLARQVAFMERHRELALLGTAYTEIDFHGTPIGCKLLPSDCMNIRWSLLFFCPFVHSSVMLRRSSISGVMASYDEAYSYAQDYELWSRIAFRLPVANLTESLVRYRITSSSMTATYGSIVDEEIDRIRLANIGRFLGCSEDKNELRSDIRDMTSLFINPWMYERPERAIHSAKMMLRLHQAFCRYYNVGLADSRIQRTNLCRRNGKNLIAIAHRCFDEDGNTARKLLLHAFRLNWRAIVKKNFIGLSLKILMGRHIVRAIRRLLPKPHNRGEARFE
jgi:glycosyltransferase involved in cell wall biosynthesis